MGSLERIHGIAHVSMPTTPPTVRVSRDPRKRGGSSWNGDEPQDILDLHDESEEAPIQPVMDAGDDVRLDLSA